MPRRATVSAVLDKPLGARPGFEQLARLAVYEEDDVLHAAPVPGCATLAENMSSVNAFLAVPAGLRYEAGETVEVELLGTVAGAWS